MLVKAMQLKWVGKRGDTDESGTDSYEEVQPIWEFDPKDKTNNNIHVADPNIVGIRL